MKKIDLAQTVGVLANVGVIAGIVFLIVELGQNNTALESQSRMNHAVNRSEFFYRISTDPILMPIIVKSRSGQSLDAVEEGRLFSYYAGEFIAWQWEWEESERGRLELPVTAWRSAFAVGNKGPLYSPLALTAWERMRHLLQPGFVAYMESDILSGP